MDAYAEAMKALESAAECAGYTSAGMPIDYIKLSLHTRDAILQALREREWMPIENGLPPIDQPVWMRLEHGSIIVGARGEDSDGWLWGNCYGSQYFDTRTNAWNAGDCEADDDYTVTHWQPLPAAPTDTGGQAT